VDTTAHNRIALHALGCKLNQAELQELAIAFESRGFCVVGARDDADAYVINTCTVTAEADRKARQWLRTVRRNHPESLVVACGCGVESGRAQLEPLTDLLITNREKAVMVELVAARLPTQLDGELGDEQERRSGRTRSLVKVQEGCATPCTYCIVPYVRRGEESRPVEDVLSTVRSRIRDGYKEIVLTGTKLGAYRDGAVTLVGLLRQVLGLPGLGRARLCRHFHLSLQSGSRTVLERMRRQYDPGEYAGALQRVRSAVPDAAITTDVIVGFPGETDDDFEETLDIVARVAFDHAFTFIYSPREGTPAASLAETVPRPVAQARFDRLVELVRDLSLASNERQVGTSALCLIEGPSRRDEGVLAARTPHNRLVHAPLPRGAHADMLAGSLRTIHITGAHPWFLTGELAEDD